jgi:hypothetical protein
MALIVLQSFFSNGVKARGSGGDLAAKSPCDTAM